MKPESQEIMRMEIAFPFHFTFLYISPLFIVAFISFNFRVEEVRTKRVQMGKKRAKTKSRWRASTEMNSSNWTAWTTRTRTRRRSKRRPSKR